MKKQPHALIVHSAVLLLYVAITLVFTYPLVRQFTTHILGDGFDSNQFPLGFWWVKTALVDLNTNPLATDYLFYPAGTSLVFHTMTFLNGLLSIPFQHLFGLTATVNLFSLLTFVLSAYGAFLLVDYLVQHKIAALIGGCIFGFFPYRFMAATGFYHVLNTQWIPFYVLFLFKTVRESKWRNSVWAGIFLLLTALNSYNYLIFLCLFTLLYFVYLTFTEPEIIASPLIRRLALCGGVFLAGFAPVLLQAAHQLNLHGDFISSDVIGTDLLFFFLPSLFHPVFGNMVAGLHHRLSACIPFTTVYAGYSVLALALFAGIRRGKSPLAPLYERGGGKSPQRRKLDGYVATGFWLLSALIFFLFSLGPYLQVNGQHVFHIGRFSFSVPLPHLLLLKIPVLGGARIAGRFSVMLMLSLAVLAGYACAVLMAGMADSRHPNVSRIVAGIIGLLVLFEYLSFPYPRLHPQSVPSIYTTIAQDPDDCSILQIPLQFKSGGKTIAIGSSDVDLCQVVHKKRLIGGYVARVPDAVMDYFARLPVIERLLFLQQGGELTQEAIAQDTPYARELIRFLHLKYITIHHEDRIGIGFFMRAEQAEVLKNMTGYILAVFPVEEFARDETVTIYRVIAPQDAPQPAIDFGTPAARFYLGYGWSSEDEDQNQHVTLSRMVRRKADLLLRFPRIADQACTLRVAPFYTITAPEQSLTISVNGKFVKNIALSSSWNTYAFDVTQDALTGGINRITFNYHDADFLGNLLGDKRLPYIAFDRLECAAQ